MNWCCIGVTRKCSWKNQDFRKFNAGKWHMKLESPIWNLTAFLILTPQGQLSLQGTFGVWTDVEVLWTKADEGEAGM